MDHLNEILLDLVVVDAGDRVLCQRGARGCLARQKGYGSSAIRPYRRQVLSRAHVHILKGANACIAEVQQSTGFTSSARRLTIIILTYFL
jgi:hypothetical protein